MKIIPSLLNKYLPFFETFYWAHINKGEKAYCMCFHDVSGGESVFTISKNDYYSIVNQIENRIVEIDDIKGNGIVITFDDGYESLLSTVLPYMKEKNLPFTAYITTDYLNRPGYLTTKQLKLLAKSDLCTIGSHMVTHRKTREMSKEEIRNEWIDSKKLLEDIIGYEVNHAALPYGSYYSCSIKSKHAALDFGYKTVADTISVPFSPKAKIISRYVYQNNNTRITDLITELKINDITPF